MASITKYLFLIIGLLLLFNAAGLPTASSKLLDFLGINFFNGIENITLGSFFLGVAAIFTGVTIAGIAIGIALGNRDPVTFLLAGYAALALTFAADLTSIVTYALSNYTWEGYIVALIGIPIIGGYMHSVISWWAGK